MNALDWLVKNYGLVEAALADAVNNHDAQMAEALDGARKEAQAILRAEGLMPAAPPPAKVVQLRR